MDNRNLVSNGRRYESSSLTGTDGTSSVTNNEYNIVSSSQDSLTHSSYYGPFRLRVNDFSFTKVRRTALSGSASSSGSYGSSTTYTRSYTVDGDFQATFAPSWDTGIDNNYVYNKALEGFAEKLRGSKLELAVAAAEAKSTYRMINTAVRGVARIRQIAQQVRRRGFTSDNWLALQYGWLPVLSDVHAVCTQEFARAPFFDISNAFSQRRSRATPDTTKTWNSCTGTLSIQQDASRRYKFGCRVSLDDIPTDAYSQLSSWDPLTIGWELLPYSFVVDWFVGIGGFLETRSALSRTRGITTSLAYSTYTSLDRAEHRWTCDKYAGVGKQNYAFGSASGYHEVKVLRRIAYNGDLPSPRPPVLNFKASLYKFANGLSLLEQLMRPRK